MHVLLNEQLPHHLAREIRGHDVSTVQQRGWAGLQNGELLRVAADAGFEVLMTADRNLQFSKSLAIMKRGCARINGETGGRESLFRAR
jgi:hypothetical protein